MALSDLIAARQHSSPPLESPPTSGADEAPSSGLSGSGGDSSGDRKGDKRPSSPAASPTGMDSGSSSLAFSESTTSLDRGTVTSGEYPQGESAAKSSVVAEQADSEVVFSWEKKELAEVSHRQLPSGAPEVTGRRPENEPEGETSTHSGNESPSVTLEEASLEGVPVSVEAAPATSLDEGSGVTGAPSSEERPSVVPEGNVGELAVTTEGEGVYLPVEVNTNDADAQDDPAKRASSLDSSGEPGVSEVQEPWGVAEQEHPSGICVYFQAGPKRLYRLRGKADTPSGAQYTDWKEVPSVSTVLDILEKGGLSWWGQRIGVAGVLELSKQQKICWGVDGEAFVGRGLLEWQLASTEEIVELLKQNKLTVNHVRDHAGDRGTNVHTALELWAEKGVTPQVAVYAPEEQGYVQALTDFLIDSGAEAVASEVMVGSMKHKYAGRYDLEALIPNNAEVVTKTYPKRKPIREHIEGGLWLIDLKTSKSTYKTHALQLAAYEAARIECGLEPTVAQGVLHVTSDGRYELVRSKAKISHFKSILAAYKVMQKDIL